MSHSAAKDPYKITVTDAAPVNLVQLSEIDLSQTAVVIGKPDTFTGDVYFELRPALKSDPVAGNPPANVAAVRENGKYQGAWPITLNVTGTSIWATLGAGQGSVDLKVTRMCDGGARA